jgi:hypothetical protein
MDQRAADQPMHRRVDLVAGPLAELRRVARRMHPRAERPMPPLAERRRAERRMPRLAAELLRVVECPTLRLAEDLIPAAEPQKVAQRRSNVVEKGSRFYRAGCFFAFWPYRSAPYDLW